MPSVINLMKSSTVDQFKVECVECEFFQILDRSAEGFPGEDLQNHVDGIGHKLRIMPLEKPGPE